MPTTRDIRNRAAEIVESGKTTRIVDAVDWATTQLAASTDMFHMTNEELRVELGVNSLALWESLRTKAEVLSALRGEAKP